MTKREPRRLPEDPTMCGEVDFNTILRATGLGIVEENLKKNALSGDLKTMEWKYAIEVVERIASNAERVRRKMEELKRIVESVPAPGSDGRCQSTCPGWETAPPGAFNILGFCKIYQIKIGPIEYYNPDGCPGSRRIKGPPIFKESSL